MRGGRARLSRKAVEDAYGRNCVARLPSGQPMERLTTPWGTEVVVLHDPDPDDLRLLVGSDALASVRFWLSPCGDHAVAWTAGDVAHFQLFCGLMDRGWHQGRLDLRGDAGPVVTVQAPVVDLLVAGGAAARMAGGAYLVSTGGREFRIVAKVEDAAGPCRPAF